MTTRPNRGFRLTTLLVSLALAAAGTSWSPTHVGAEGLSVFRESSEQSGAINPADFKQVADALQGKVKVVDIVNFGRLKFLSWPSRRRLTYAAIDQFADFVPVTPPAALDGYRAPVVERVAPLKVQFALKVKSLNKLLSSVASPALFPAELEGKTFTMSTFPELRVRYPARDLKRRGDLLLSETRPPVLEVPPGVDLNQVRNALMALPLWPEQLRREFASVPVGEPGNNTIAFDFGDTGEDPERVRVNGNPGIFLEIPRDHGPRLSPRALELQREASRAAEESGDPYAGEHMRGNTLLWRQGGLLLSLTSQGLTLEQALAVAEAMR